MIAIPSNPESSASLDSENDQPRTFVESSSSYPDRGFEEIVEMSSLVVRGTVTKESKELLIRSVDGHSKQWFYDTFVDVSEVYRREAPDKRIAVRLSGGPDLGEDVFVAAQDGLSLQPGDECILFLWKPNFGGDCITKGDYYLPVSSIQAAYFLHKDGGFTCSKSDKVLHLESFKGEMAELNAKLPIDYDFHRKQIEGALRGNIESGFVTTDGELKRFYDEIDSYAEIISSKDVIAE